MIKDKFFQYLIFGVVSVLITISWFGFSGISRIVSLDSANAATSSAVTVSASVTATISCASNNSSTALGTLTSAAIFTSSPNVSSTMSCANSGAGCTLSVKDAGSGANPGLWNSTSSALIASPNAAYSATTTLVAGTEGFGIQATTTALGSGGAFTIGSRYLQTGNTVGGLTIAGTTLASTSATSSNREVVVTHLAAISSATVGGTYNDTITYSCIAN